MNFLHRFSNNTQISNSMKIRLVGAELFHTDRHDEAKSRFSHVANAPNKTGYCVSHVWFDPGWVHVGFVVDNVALGQVFPRVLRFSPVDFIPPVLHYLEKWKKLIIFLFITGLHNKPQGCGASVASAAGPFCTPPPPPKKRYRLQTIQYDTL
jgi:hypothetical protein